MGNFVLFEFVWIIPGKVFTGGFAKTRSNVIADLVLNHGPEIGAANLAGGE